MKRKLNMKKLLIFISVLIVLIIVVLLLVLKPKNNNKPNKSKKDNKTVEKKPVVPKEKVDIIDINSKSRPFAVVVNNTPVAIKVQEGLNKAYIVYEIPTEGSTSRLMALYKDADKDLTIGTVRSVRHNFIDYALESDAILVGYGYSVYAEDQLNNKHVIDYMNGMIHSKPYWRSNPEHLASEHTAYTSISKIEDFAFNSKKYKKDSDNTVLLKYNVGEVDLSKQTDAKTANTVTLPYGSVTTKFTYNPETKMYTRNVNGKETVDHKTKEPFTTKNIIVQKITFGMMDNNYYWDLHTIGSGEGYYITNGYAVPIKWSKSSRSAKTKYTYLDGKEIEVSDGRTYIEVQVTSRSTTIE